ncbi:hypothetical protein QYF61_002567 [Mycteria americana]|uniref:Arf-GAP with coiled-coil, ANK repeat and PH domain-containing protein n=1 Tax=Mycteria americana TaxID=33587 RepID=A0AAN7MM75_MYCAM|nr:hypothetical protein QYF61_002567 [Mycteria americana]
MILTISSSLGSSDVRKFKETKKQFDKVREDMEISLVKNAQAPRHKPHEVEEATGTLTITRKCFRHLALDYVLQPLERQTLVDLLHLLHLAELIFIVFDFVNRPEIGMVKFQGS